MTLTVTLILLSNLSVHWIQRKLTAVIESQYASYKFLHNNTVINGCFPNEWEKSEYYSSSSKQWQKIIKN